MYVTFIKTVTCKTCKIHRQARCYQRSWLAAALLLLLNFWRDGGAGGGDKLESLILCINKVVSPTMYIVGLEEYRMGAIIITLVSLVIKNIKPKI